eukprot:751363-Hanusia_phi.AAC.2
MKESRTRQVQELSVQAEDKGRTHLGAEKDGGPADESLRREATPLRVDGAVRWGDPGDTQGFTGRKAGARREISPQG